jgi:hypothetical protein
VIGSWAGCCIPEIPANWEVEVGGSQPKAGPGKKHETLSEKQKTKGLGVWLMWYSALSSFLNTEKTKQTNKKKKYEMIDISLTKINPHK